MSTFLQILGAIFLGIIALAALVVIVVGLRVRRAIKLVGQTMEQMSSLAVPARVHLDRADGVTWDHKREADRYAEAFAGQGFQDAGQFVLREMPGVKLWAFVHPAESVYAVAYEHPQAGAWIDYVARYADGTSITFSNTPHGQELDHQPGHDKQYHPGADAADLFRAFQAARPRKESSPVSAAGFPEVFEAAYASEMDWRNSRGGPTDREVRAIACQSGMELSDDEIDAAREELAEQAILALEDPLRERFLETSGLSARQWEDLRDSLVIVHDRLTPEMLSDLVNEWYEPGEEDDPDPDDDLDTDLPPRESFARFNRTLPRGRQFQKVGEVSDPVGADFYRAPT